MPKQAADPLDAIATAARALPRVVEGSSCTQTSFKVGTKAFLYLGEQGGRCKTMFRLRASLEDAERMAADAPKDVQIGTHGWVTARFGADAPLAARTWRKWLNESYAIATGE